LRGFRARHAATRAAVRRSAVICSVRKRRFLRAGTCGRNASAKARKGRNRETDGMATRIHPRDRPARQSGSQKEREGGFFTTESQRHREDGRNRAFNAKTLRCKDAKNSEREGGRKGSKDPARRSRNRREEEADFSPRRHGEDGETQKDFLTADERR